MKLNKALLISMVLVFTLALSACGGSGEDPESAPEAEIPNPEEQEAETEGEEYDYDDSASGTDLEGVNVCTQIPIGDVSAIVGPLREDETEQDISIAGEVGCTYYDQQGHFYDLTYYPLFTWGTVQYTLNEAEELNGVLDGAWLGSYSGGEITVKALVDGELVIGAHISTEELEIAKALLELAYENKP